MKQDISITSTIDYVCLSPHGFPDGIFLEDGRFVKIHPHELKEAAGFKVGAKVTVTGHAHEETMIDHATVKSQGRVLSSSVEVEEEDDKVEGTILYYLSEDDYVTTLFLDGGVTVKVPKHEELSEEDLTDRVEVHGKVRNFDSGKFIKAKKFKWLQ